MSYKQQTFKVLEELHKALEAVDEKQVNKFIQDVLSAEKVFFVGVGRVKLSLEATAKRFSHLGISAHVVGDITEPAITAKDLLIVGSGSGNTIFPVAIAKKAKSLGAKVIHIGSNPESQLKGIADFMVRIPVRTKLYLQDEIESTQPMTSLFEQSLLLFGDITAKMMVKQRGLDLKDLWQFHANLE